MGSYLSGLWYNFLTIMRTCTIKTGRIWKIHRRQNKLIFCLKEYSLKLVSLLRITLNNSYKCQSYYIISKNLGFMSSLCSRILALFLIIFGGQISEIFYEKHQTYHQIQIFGAILSRIWQSLFPRGHTRLEKNFFFKSQRFIEFPAVS